MRNILYCLLVLAGTVTALSSCRTHNVSAPIVVTQRNAHSEDTLQRNNTVIIDTIYRDRWHNTFATGDTVYIHDSVYLEKIRYRYVTDTLRVHTYDTVPGDPVYADNPVYVEKQLSSGTRFLRNSGIVLWCVLGLLVISMVIGIIIKFAK